MLHFLQTIFKKLQTPYAGTFFAFIIFGVFLFMVAAYFSNLESLQSLETIQYTPSALSVTTQRMADIFFFPATPIFALVEYTMVATSEFVVFKPLGIVLLPMIFVLFFAFPAMLWSLPVWGILYIVQRLRKTNTV